MNRQDLRVRHITKDMLSQGYTPPAPKESQWKRLIISASLDVAKTVITVAVACVFWAVIVGWWGGR